MNSKVCATAIAISMLSIPLPAVAQSAEQWRAEIHNTYNLPSYPTPVTDQFLNTGNRATNYQLWRAEIKQRYGIRDYQTPITDQFGDNTSEWYKRLSYGRSTPVTDGYYNRSRN